MTLIHGDVRDVLPELDHVDLIFTDPPYRTISGGNRESGNQPYGKPSGMLSKNDGKIFEHNDIKPREFMGMLFDVLVPRSHIYVMSNNLNRREIEDAMIDVGFKIHNLMIWEKNNATPNRWGMKNVEYIFLGRKGPAFPLNDCGTKTCEAFDNILGTKTHPTEKPVDMITRHVLNSSQPGQTVLDPFCGTGSTGVACRDTGRKFIGVDSDLKYLGVAGLRLGETVT